MDGEITKVLWCLSVTTGRGRWAAPPPTHPTPPLLHPLIQLLAGSQITVLLYYGLQKVFCFHFKRLLV